MTSAEGADEATASRSDRIIDGTPSEAVHGAGLLLVRSDRKSLFDTCSATLVGPSLVLTARHCVTAVAPGPFLCDDQGQLLSESVGGRFRAETPLEQLYVFASAARPDFTQSASSLAVGVRAAKVFHDDATVACNHDVALVQLEHAIAGAPIAALRLDGDVAVGETVTVTGYGIDETSKLVPASAFAEVGEQPWLENGRDPRLAPEGKASCAMGPSAPVDDRDRGAVCLLALAGYVVLMRRRVTAERA